jgi:hypothetical protein
MKWLLLWLLGSPVTYEEQVAVEAAYAIVTFQQDDTPSKCCGKCVGGKMLHGDGHITDCPCPPECECKRHITLVHPPIRIR